MDMRDKVIKGVECCIKYPNEYGDCLGGDCPYGPRIECHKELMRDVLALLKAQEPVERKPYDNFDYLCGSCNRVISRRYDYCPWCGKAVKRNG